MYEIMQLFLNLFSLFYYKFVAFIRLFSTVSLCILDVDLMMFWIDMCILELGENMAPECASDSRNQSHITQKTLVKMILVLSLCFI